MSAFRSSYRSSIPWSVVLASAGFLASENRRRSRCDKLLPPSQQHVRMSQLIFIGSGSSTGSPSPYCLMHPEDTTKTCITDRRSVELPAELNRNYRNNPSVLIRYLPPPTKEGEIEPARHIQIDVGKTFREGVCRWYPRHQVSSLDGIILTHDHADAILGLDDVRGLQLTTSPPMPVHADARTLRTLKRVFPYLCNGFDTGIRRVANLDFHPFEFYKPFNVVGLEVTSIPVVHGEDYISNAFVFGPDNGKILYISDCSRITDEVMEFLLSLKVDTLIVDSLFEEINHPTHFNLTDALALTRKLRPRRTLVIGMSSSIEHYSTNAKLATLRESEGLDVRLSYDGLAVDIDLTKEGVTHLEDSLAAKLANEKVYR